MRKIIFIPVMIFLLTISNLLADDDGLNNYKNKKFEEAKSYYEQILLAKENDPTREDYTDAELDVLEEYWDGLEPDSDEFKAFVSFVGGDTKSKFSKFTT